MEAAPRAPLLFCATAYNGTGSSAEYCVVFGEATYHYHTNSQDNPPAADAVAIAGDYHPESANYSCKVVGRYLGNEFNGGWLPYSKKGSLNRFLFQGCEWDHMAEVCDFGGSIYSPRLGRCLNPGAGVAFDSSGGPVTTIEIVGTYADGPGSFSIAMMMVGLGSGGGMDLGGFYAGPKQHYRNWFDKGLDSCRENLIKFYQGGMKGPFFKEIFGEGVDNVAGGVIANFCRRIF